MDKNFSIDLGTNSIGYAKRDIELGHNLIDQLGLFGAVMFKKGVGNGKTGEFSFAAERTKHRSSRRLYQARKYRIWKTLKVLIDPANKNKKDDDIDLDKRGIYCPLTMRQLNQWRKYDKEAGQKRQYPIDVIEFEQWVRLDFDGDGKADYSSPYELRAELATVQLDFNIEINRYKLGRALYHIAQRRGFKSSKGETLKEQEDATKEALDVTESSETEATSLKKSEEKKSQHLSDYLAKNNLPTIGCAFYQLEKEGVRIRGSIYQSVRSQYRDEVKYIFEFQKRLDVNSDFFKVIYSDKKEGSIFYKRPLRSQKGLVGKCTLEPTKYRCPISHPEFEKFRAFAFINNIQYRTTSNDAWTELTAEQKLKLFNEKFLLMKPNFKFESIREWIQKEIGKTLSWSEKKAERTINYKDKTNVSGCPISGRLKNLLRKDWENFVYKTTKQHENKTTKEIKEYDVQYNTEDIWHVCFSYDDEEHIVEFAKTQLHFNDTQTDFFVKLWMAIAQGYSMLSLKAIKNINRFLVPNINKVDYKGLIYTDAALLAKIPEILGEKLWIENEQLFLHNIDDLIEKNRSKKRILNIVNNLIANYKSLEHEEQFAYKNAQYQLDNSDLKAIEEYTKESFGAKTWETETNKKGILDDVKEKYQQFFASSKRDYFKLPKLGDTIKEYLSENFDFLRCANNGIDPETKLTCQCDACKKINKLYHPSMIEFYKPAKEKDIEHNGVTLSKKLLESPIIGAFKNPMAMRTLHELRKLINSLLLEGQIDEETRIIVETARDLNDANMRWAIEAYQRERETENKEFEKAIKELAKSNHVIGDEDIDKARLLVEQHPDYMFPKEKRNQIKDYLYKKDITKYRLWLEQGMKCIYTGKPINLTTLFSQNNLVEIEHTIPRSISFDNSLSNKTICFTHYNRFVKRNQIPTQLINYSQNTDEYSAIEPRLEAWKEKVIRLKENVEFWKLKSKTSQNQESKNNAIRQRHLWEMELDYWQNKLDRFTMTDVTSGFKNSQLNDTRLITKYAYHYLKSVFSKVDVQKGSVTADFRKMLGVQSVDEKKNRDKHSHHAIDAAILSCIPVAAKRDRMLELFYKIQEEKKLNHPTDYLERELDREKKSCNIGDITNLSKYIEENILINHVSKDQTLTPAKRKARKRGKEVFVKNENGELVTKWIKGDCIRGQLHQETFYGKIKIVKRDENDSPLRNGDGKWLFEEGEKEFRYVVRKPIGSVTKLEQIVNPELQKVIQRQLNGRSLEKALSDGVYMLDKTGQPVGNKIRHIRCWADVTKPIPIKKQTYLSDKEYKQDYYAANAENTLYGLYWDGKSKERGYECLNLYQVVQIRKLNDPQTLEEYFPSTKMLGRGKKRVNTPLYAVLKPDMKVIFYKDSRDELLEMSVNELSKRLYKMNRIFDSNTGVIQFYHHLEARDDKELMEAYPESEFGKKGKNGFSQFNYEFPCPRLLMSCGSFNFIIEGKDFIAKSDGKLEFLYK